MGGSTVGTIIGNRIAPKIADLYLAATNVKAQQTDNPVKDDRRDYLFSPLPDDRGAHGPFDDEAKGRSLQLRPAPIGGCSQPQRRARSLPDSAAALRRWG